MSTSLVNLASSLKAAHIQQFILRFHVSKRGVPARLHGLDSVPLVTGGRLEQIQLVIEGDIKAKT
jgi:hypothetical protein